MKAVLALASFLFCAAKVSDLPPAPSYETRWFTNLIDHFDFQNSGTYQQRYLYADKYWGTNPPTPLCKGPIFFYTGNESPVDSYYPASGFFTQVLAPKFGALLIFAEHRYFGESMPFGNASFDPGNVGFLSTDQALADYAVLLTTLKTELKAENCPVFAFGGSYGGMLTAWFRSKYPNIVMGGLAASAPFGFLGTDIPPSAFDDACTNTFETSAAGCSAAVQDFWQQFQTAASSPSGLALITESMKLCSPLQSYNDAENLLDWVLGGLADMAMLDYPYSTNYGIEVVAWPVNTTCNRLLSGSGDIFERMGYAIGSFYNASGQYSCYNITSDNPVWGTGNGWPYLACTTVYMPSAGSGMFPPAPYNVTYDIESCQQQFGVNLQPYWPYTHWGGAEIFQEGLASNIIFSNGLLDPWHTSGILESPSDSLVAIVIPESAHHLDLRAPNPADPVYVTAARAQEEQLITQWLNAWYNGDRSAAEIEQPVPNHLFRKTFKANLN